MAQSPPNELPDLTDADEAKSPQGKSFAGRILGSKALIGVGVVVSGGIIFGMMSFGPQREEMSPHDRLLQALELIEQPEKASAVGQARDIALSLDALGFRDPEFPGGVEFILGMAAFRDAEAGDELSREALYVQAAGYLRRAERLVLDGAYQPEWAYAFGSSLHHIGRASEARSLLEQAVKTYEPGKVAAAMLLTDIYLESKTNEEVAEALKLNDLVIASDELDQLRRDQAYLQRAQAFHLLKRNSEAEAALKNVSQETSENKGTVVFRAQTLMAEGKYALAMERLAPVAGGDGLEQTYARQALYLMGVCAENLHQVEPAIVHFRRTVQRYANSHEGLAANLRAADLLRKVEPHPRTEEALDHYRAALKLVRRPEDFRNRWVSLAEFRRRIIDAWNAWVEQGSYSEAITLSKLMPPLIPQVEAYDLAARANQRWAEALQQQFDEGGNTRRRDIEPMMRERWRLSGQAFASLATALRIDGIEALWTSAQHYHNGHDFESALIQLNEFINGQPKELLPTAIVWRGRLLMDLGRFDDALQDFSRVIANYPTDPAVFEARYVVGQCYLELDQIDAAEQAWRDVLLTPAIDPRAKEWRSALFSLGRLLYHIAGKKKWDAQKIQPPDSPEAEKLLTEAYAHLDEAVRRLEEFLKRYPEKQDAIEARYMLAQALQQNAELPRHRLASAETENARIELRKEMDSLLMEALNEFETLRMDLHAKSEVDRLDEFGQRLLMQTYFEIAHTYYLLDEYDKAIISYSSAANKYPNDTQVLLAYLQMTNCYDRLGKPEDARSMLEQANVIHNGMLDDVFAKQSTSLTKQEWKNWIDWARGLHQSFED